MKPLPIFIFIFSSFYFFNNSFAQSSNPPSAISINQQAESINQLTWTDEDAVNGESYNVYLSQNPVTNVTVNGVVKIGRNIPEGTGVFTHTCYTPQDMGTVNYYYAITSVDPNGVENTSVISGQNATEISVASKTIAVGSIALVESPVIIDGDISEFKQKAIPFVIDGNRRVSGMAVWNWLEGIQNWTGNEDLSGNVYLMMDNENLYMGFEIFDNELVQNFSGFSTWNGDAPELNIGLYHLNNLEERHQTNYQRGLEPDYQFRLSIGDEVWMHVPWAGYPNEDLPNHVIDYAEIVTLPFISQDGYYMEVKIPFNDLVNDPDMQVHPGGVDSLFHPENGMLVPLNITLNDADDPDINYEGNFYYYWGDTTGFRPFVSPKWWSWTLIGDFNTVTSLAEEDKIKNTISSFNLNQNYPNPFNPKTTIQFELNTASHVKILVYDITGKIIAELANNFFKVGQYKLIFESGELPSGIYFYTLFADEYRQTRKMTLIR